MLSELEAQVHNHADILMYEQLAIETAPIAQKRIGDMICTGISHYRLEKEQKSEIRDTLNRLNADSFGSLAVMLDLIPYFELKFYDQEETVDLCNSYVDHLMLYLLKTIRKAEFVKKIWLLQEAVGISNEFYNALIDYYGNRRTPIIEPILKRI